jgi:hypothetical protein
MSTWYDQDVSIIGRTKDLAKLLNMPIYDEAGVEFGTISFSGGRKNGSPFNIDMLSNKYPNVIFAVTTHVECESEFTRYLEQNGKSVFVSNVEPHCVWANNLSYNKTVDAINNGDELSVIPCRIPITEDTEVFFVAP